MLQIISDIFGNRIQVLNPSMYDYYDINVGTDMATALSVPSVAAGGIDVVNDLIPFPEEIDEANESMIVYGIELHYNIENIPEDVTTPTTTKVDALALDLLDVEIGFFEFDEVESSADYTTNLLEESEERLCRLRIGALGAGHVVYSTAYNYYQNFDKIQLTDAVVFENGFEFPLNPSAKFIRKMTDNGFSAMDFENNEDLLTIRIWYKKVRRSRTIFSRILSLFRQNVDA